MSRNKTPEMPEFYQLEQTASAEELSLAGSWWITLQLVEHVFYTISRYDGLTYSYMPDLLSSYLERYFYLLKLQSIRPIPHDKLYQLIISSYKYFEKILEQPKSKIIKEDRKIPFYKAEKINSKTMSWLGRQPGRTIKDKLSKTHKILAPVSDFSYELEENRLVVQVLKELIEKIDERIKNGINKYAYDLSEDSGERNDKLERFLKLTHKLKKSTLAEMKPVLNIQPNNVLISDRNYSIIWRTFQQLTSYKYQLGVNWDFAFERYFHTLYWGVCSYLSALKNSFFVEDFVSIIEENDRIDLDLLHHQSSNKQLRFVIVPELADFKIGRIETIIEKEQKKFGFVRGEDNRAYYFNPRSIGDKELFNKLNKDQRVFFKTEQVDYGKDRIVELKIDCIYICIAKKVLDKDQASMVFEIFRLAGKNNKYSSSSKKNVNTYRYEFQVEENSILKKKRGINFSVKRYSGDEHIDEAWSFKNYADMKGIRSLSRRVLQELLSEIGEDIVFNKTEEIGNELLLDPAFDFSTFCPVLFSDGEKITDEKKFSFYSVKFNKIKDNNTIFRSNQLKSYYPDTDIITLNQILTENDQDTFQSFKSTILELNDRFALKEDSYFSYTIPDIMDEFSQGTIKSVLNAAYKRTFPVWRSIAAALYWQKNSSLTFRGDENIIVIDTQQPSITATLLKVFYDDHLRDYLFEHYLPFPVDDKDYQLTYKQIQRSYLDLFLKKNNILLSNREKENVMKTGIVENVLKEKKEYVTSYQSGEEESYIRIYYQQKIFETVLKQWSSDFRNYAWKIKKDDKIKNPVEGNTYVLFIGDLLNTEDIKLFTKKYFAKIEFLTADNILSGVEEVSRRLRNNLPTWKEFLPDLYLEVIKDGHFAKLTLIKDKSVNQVFGQEQKFEIEDTMILTKDNKYYSFPLIKSDVGNNPVNYDARIESDSFPLKEDMEVKLQIKYKYGFENSYNLNVIPVETKDAPFKKIPVKWVKEEILDAENDFLSIPNYEIDESELTYKIRVLNSVEKEFMGTIDIFENSTPDEDLALVIIEYLKKNKNKVRDILRNDQDERVKEYIDSFKNGKMMEYLLSIGEVDGHSTDLFKSYSSEVRRKLKRNALLFLCNFGGYTPMYIQKYILDQNISNDKIEMLGRLLYKNLDNEQILAEILTILKKSRDHKRINKAIRAITLNIWLDVDLVYIIKEKDPVLTGIILTIIDNMLSGFSDMLNNKWNKMESDNSEWVYTNRFRDYMELILSILRLRETTEDDKLRAGSSMMLNLARKIRRIDSQFYRLSLNNDKWQIGTRINFSTEKPNNLRNMSDLAYVLHQFLTGAKESNLIEVISVEDKD